MEDNKEYLLKYLEAQFPCRVFTWVEQEKTWSSSDRDVIKQVKENPYQIQFAYEIPAEYKGKNHELVISFGNNTFGFPFVEFKVKERGNALKQLHNV